LSGVTDKHRLNESSSSSLEASALRKKSDRGQTKLNTELAQLRSLEVSKRAYEERKKQAAHLPGDGKHEISEFYLRSSSVASTDLLCRPKRDSVVSIIRNDSKLSVSQSKRLII